MNRWQFSLRRLFIVVTLVAGIVAFAANYPGTAIVCFLFSLIFVAGRATALLVVHAPLVAKCVTAMAGSLYLAGAAYAFARAYDDHELGQWGFWIALLVITGIGLLCFWAAWAIPSKMSQTKQKNLKGSEQ
jgi:hypothetical protein